uniref:Putative secreted peptide n=1 Tax=Anopheles braziliensis TaxID=58242 RepID=A0A2M3ZNN7_9DIPT
MIPHATLLLLLRLLLLLLLLLELLLLLLKLLLLLLVAHTKIFVKDVVLQHEFQIGSIVKWISSTTGIVTFLLIVTIGATTIARRSCTATFATNATTSLIGSGDILLACSSRSPASSARRRSTGTVMIERIVKHILVQHIERTDPERYLKVHRFTAHMRHHVRLQLVRRWERTGTDATHQRFPLIHATTGTSKRATGQSHRRCRIGRYHAPQLSSTEMDAHMHG